MIDCHRRLFPAALLFAGLMGAAAGVETPPAVGNAGNSRPPVVETDEPAKLPRAKLDEGVFLQSGDVKVMTAQVDRMVLLWLTAEKRQNPRNVPAPDRVFQGKIQIAQHLLQNAAIENYARVNKLEATKEELDQFVAIKKAELQRTNSSYEQMLADTGQSDVEFRRFWGAKIAIQRDVTEKITTAEVDESFAKIKDQYPLRSAAHILIQYKHAHHADDAVTRTKEQAKELAEDTLKQLKAGKDFAEMLKRSDDDATKEKGGVMPFYPLRGKETFFADRFGTAIYALKEVGDYGPIIESQYGFHVIRLAAKRDDEYKLEVRRDLARQKSEKLFADLLLKTLEAAKFNESVK